MGSGDVEWEFGFEVSARAMDVKLVAGADPRTVAAIDGHCRRRWQQLVSVATESEEVAAGEFMVRGGAWEVARRSCENRVEILCSGLVRSHEVRGSLAGR